MTIIFPPANLFSNTGTVPTPRADRFLASLYYDEKKNVMCTLGEGHSHLLNNKNTRKNDSLEVLKGKMTECRNRILLNMADQIADQNQNELSYQFSLFNVEQQDSLDVRREKLAGLYTKYGQDKFHRMEETWYVLL